MVLIQILLPLYDNNGQPFPQETYNGVRDELTQQFGGLTTYVRSPARGLWQEEEGKTVRDDIVIYEVMAEQLDRAWWQAYREQLRRTYRQEELVIRANEIELL